MLLRLRNAIFFMCLSVGFSGAATADGPLQILTMGDSMMASHSLSKRAIPNVIGKAVNARVVDRSVSGARIIYNLPITGSMGLNIAKQFRPGRWDWIVVNGGGNDLWLGCGCRSCDRKMNRMITKTGARGEIPNMVRKLRSTGAQVIYVGYLRSPGTGSPIEQCQDEGNELESRISKLAASDKGVHFVSLANLVPNGDRSYHALDMIHPSLKGSRAIGQRIGQVIKK